MNRITPSPALPDDPRDMAGIMARRPFFAELSHLVPVAVTGGDGEAFLQAQLSNDVAQLGEHALQRHAYCNPKGRALATIDLVRPRDGNGPWMLVPHDVVEPLLARLRMFVLRADVRFEAARDRAVFGVCAGPDDAAPAGGFACPAPGHGHILVAERDPRPEALSGLHELPAHAWRLMDILCGIPRVYAATMEAFIPQSVNLDLVDGVSFRKGCYPGQEIVARIRYLGKSKQRMIAARISGAENVAPAMEVFSAERPEQKSGMVVDAVRTGPDSHVASVAVSAGLLDGGAIHLGSAQGPELERLPLPYEIPG